MKLNFTESGKRKQLINVGWIEEEGEALKDGETIKRMLSLFAYFRHGRQSSYLKKVRNGQSSVGGGCACKLKLRSTKMHALPRFMHDVRMSLGLK